jgi:hypothetical protein
MSRKLEYTDLSIEILSDMIKKNATVLDLPDDAYIQAVTVDIVNGIVRIFWASDSFKRLIECEYPCKHENQTMR